MNNQSTTSTNPRTWLITGASSGIGLSLARAAAGRGDNVVAIARKAEGLTPLTDEFGGRVLARAADVADERAVKGVVDETVGKFGRLDVVANNAGYGLFGAVEEARDRQVRAIFETNVYGVLNVLRATLPVLREQRSGHILQGSSYYGQTSHPGVGMLAATKFAVEALSDALAGELEPLGIHVTIVEPSLTATPFLSNLDVAATIGDYDQTVRAVQKSIGELPPSAFNDPDRVATAILAATDAEVPPLRLPTGSQSIQEIRTALDGRLEQLAAVATLSESVDAQVGTPAWGAASG